MPRGGDRDVVMVGGEIAIKWCLAFDDGNIFHLLKLQELLSVVSFDTLSIMGKCSFGGAMVSRRLSVEGHFLPSA